MPNGMPNPQTELCLIWYQKAGVSAYCQVKGQWPASRAISAWARMSARNVPKSRKAYGVVMKNAANASTPATKTIGANLTADHTVRSAHLPPERSFQVQRNTSASGASIGATDTLGAMAKPTSRPNRAASRMRRVSMNRSMAHNAAKDVSTVNGSGR